MNTVDEIYELIKKDNSQNTLNNNVDLFIRFYYQEMSMYYGSYKVKEIYKYLLTVDVDEEIFPTLKSNIFEDFNRYEIQITQAFYMGGFQINDSVIEKLYELIELYNYFKIYDTNNKMIDINRFTRDYTGSMIIALNKGIFNISENYVKSMVECVKNNNYIKRISTNNISNGIMDRDYIFQYLSRFLFTSEFVNIDSLKDDIFINAIFTGNIKDKKIIERIIKSIDISLIISNTNIDISNIINMLDKVYENEQDKRIMFNKIYLKLDEKGMYRELLNFMIKDSRFSIYLSLENQSKIINKCALGYLSNIKDDEARFLIGKCRDRNFLRNLKLDANSKDNNFSEETIKLINELTKDILITKPTIQEGLEILKKVFSGDNVDYDELINAFSIFTTMILGDNDLKIYFVSSSNYDGCAYTNSNAIALNITKIDDLLKCKNIENSPDKIDIIDVIFHELRHIVQYKTIDEDKIDDELYNIYKEDILINYNCGYYDNNYIGVYAEKDARVIGAQNAFMFLQKYFPNMIKCIEYYKRKYEKEISKTYESAKIFELSSEVSKDKAFDLLVLLNPNITNKYKHLKKEYNLDGTKKELEKAYNH